MFIFRIIKWGFFFFFIYVSNNHIFFGPQLPLVLYKIYKPEFPIIVIPSVLSALESPPTSSLTIIKTKNKHIKLFKKNKKKNTHIHKTWLQKQKQNGLCRKDGNSSELPGMMVFEIPCHKHALYRICCTIYCTEQFQGLKCMETERIQR